MLGRGRGQDCLDGTNGYISHLKKKTLQRFVQSYQEYMSEEQLGSGAANTAGATTYHVSGPFHFPLESFMAAMAMCKLLPLSPQMAQRGRGSSHGMLWCMPYLPHHPPSGYASNVFNSLLSDSYGYLCLSGCHTMMGRGA